MALLNFFRKKNTDTVPSTNTPAATGISYYDNLIDELVADHEHIDVLKNRIQAEYRNKQRKQLIKSVQELKTLIQGHILKENLRLYAYLQQKLTDHPDSKHIVASFRQEMDQISRPILRFLDRFNEISSMSENDLAQFVLDLNDTLDKVNERMAREEAVLYPLYQPHY